MPDKTTDTEGWTILVCQDCGCVHDRPDAGCPECESRCYEMWEVVPATALQQAESERDLLRTRVEEAEARLQAISEGKPYTNCWGDCGEIALPEGRPGYCCGGEWDFKNRAEAAESETKRLREALRTLHDSVERDLREPDKLLCHTLSARRALTRSALNPPEEK